MKNIIFLFLLQLLSLTKSFAQNDLPPVYEITTDTANYYTIPQSNWQTLKDKEAKLNFKQVSTAPITTNFQYSKDNMLSWDKTIRSYWFRFVLKNAMNHTAKICLGDSSG